VDLYLMHLLISRLVGPVGQRPKALAGFGSPPSISLTRALGETSRETSDHR
jgi:hypothetical protein